MNGKRSTNEFDVSVNMGPETDVDVVNDIPSFPSESVCVNELDSSIALK